MYVHISRGEEFRLISLCIGSGLRDPLFRGFYTFRNMNSDKYDALSATSRLVCFAGESTSTHNYSTVHGATESGFLESQMIIEHIKAK